jgi:hypothetical protein
VLGLVERLPKLGKSIPDALAIIDLLQDMVLSPEAIDGCSKRPSTRSAIGGRKNQEAVVEAPAGRTRPYAKLQTEAAKI